jgi:hypothetical protein
MPPVLWPPRPMQNWRKPLAFCSCGCVCWGGGGGVWRRSTGWTEPVRGFALGAAMMATRPARTCPGVHRRLSRGWAAALSPGSSVPRGAACSSNSAPMPMTGARCRAHGRNQHRNEAPAKRGPDLDAAGGPVPPPGGPDGVGPHAARVRGRQPHRPRHVERGRRLGRARHGAGAAARCCAGY